MLKHRLGGRYVLLNFWQIRGTTIARRTARDALSERRRTEVRCLAPGTTSRDARESALDPGSNRRLTETIDVATHSAKYARVRAQGRAQGPNRAQGRNNVRVHGPNRAHGNCLGNDLFFYFVWELFWGELF